MRTLKRILGVLLIFVCGVFVGGVMASGGVSQKLRELLLGGPEAVMKVMVKRLDHELKLDAEQKRKLQSIMDDAQIKLRQSRAKVQPEVEATLHEAEDRTRAILYPKQVKRFDEFVRKGRDKWKASEGAGDVPAPIAATPAPGTPLPAPGTPLPAPPEAAKPE